MLKGYQKKFLKGLAQRLKPVVLIGQQGLTDTVAASCDAALNTHELIKVKFNAFKEKQDKAAIIAAIVQKTASDHVGTVGNTAVFYRPHPDLQKRQIAVPQR
jgi:RNA-binding protein